MCFLDQLGFELWLSLERQVSPKHLKIFSKRCGSAPLDRSGSSAASVRCVPGGGESAKRVPSTIRTNQGTIVSHLRIERRFVQVQPKLAVQQRSELQGPQASVHCGTRATSIYCP